MLIFLNFGQNGGNWYVAPLALFFIFNTGFILQLFAYVFSRVAQVNLVTPLVDSPRDTCL